MVLECFSTKVSFDSFKFNFDENGTLVAPTISPVSGSLRILFAFIPRSKRLFGGGSRVGCFQGVSL